MRTNEATRDVPALSAAVCTRGRPEMAVRAASSLLEQPVAEVIVVDNAPDDGKTQQFLRERVPTARYVVEPQRGLDFARNRALHEATGDVVAFLDDDAVAAPGWAAALHRVFDGPAGARVGACTARVEALLLETDAQRLFEANGGFGRGMQRVRLPADAERPLHKHRAPLIAWAVSVGSGCSFALRRNVALGLGGFDVALDVGARLPGGGDHDMLWRVLQADYDVVYEPAALAHHEHRREEKAIFAQLAGHQRGLVAFLTKAAASARGRQRLEVLAFLIWRLLKPGVRLAFRAAGRDPLPARALLLMWRGALAGGPTYWSLRRERRSTVERSLTSVSAK